MLLAILTAVVLPVVAFTAFAMYAAVWMLFIYGAFVFFR